jgi:hypothetical protein
LFLDIWVCRSTTLGNLEKSSFACSLTCAIKQCDTAEQLCHPENRIGRQQHAAFQIGRCHVLPQPCRCMLPTYSTEVLAGLLGISQCEPLYTIERVRWRVLCISAMQPQPLISPVRSAASREQASAASRDGGTVRLSTNATTQRCSRIVGRPWPDRMPSLPVCSCAWRRTFEAQHFTLIYRM